MTATRTPRMPRLRKGLTVNAMALMTATIAAQGLGLVFWAVAARLMPATGVGRASAAISALTLLAAIAQLNLTNVFVRLLPAAGHKAEYLVRRGYFLVVGFSLVVGAVYCATALSGHTVPAGWQQAVLFILAVPVLAVFLLQDSVLTALRLTPYVALENITTAIARIALLPLLTLSVMGTIGAWVLPAFAATIVVNTLLFRRALPAHGQVDGTLPERRKLWSFVAGEYAGNICSTATVQVMPLLLLWRLGPAEAAYLTLPWLIASGISLVLWNVAASFVVEMAGAHGHPGTLLRRSLLLWGGVVAVAMVVCLAAGRLLLGLAGAGYADHGVVLFRLIGVSVPFTALVVLYSTLAWLNKRIWLLAGFQAVCGALMIVITLVLLPHIGLNAVGWAYLATQAAAAAVVTPLSARMIRRNDFGEA